VVACLRTDVDAWLADRRVNTFTVAGDAMDLREWLISRKPVAERVGKTLFRLKRGTDAYR
jgi:hypothetical protein